MIRSCPDPDPFNGSADMRLVARWIDESAAAFPLEVIVTAQAGQGSVLSTTIVIPPCADPKDVQ